MIPILRSLVAPEVVIMYAIIWTNDSLLPLIAFLRTNVSEISIKSEKFSHNKIKLKMSSAQWQPFCLSLNVFISVLSNGDRALISQWSTDGLTEHWPYKPEIHMEIWISESDLSKKV